MKNYTFTLGKHIVSIALGTIAFGLWLHNVWAAIAFCCFLSILGEISDKD
jgi:hypothetical protein